MFYGLHGRRIEIETAGEPGALRIRKLKQGLQGATLSSLNFNRDDRLSDLVQILFHALSVRMDVEASEWNTALISSRDPLTPESTYC